MPSVIAGSSSWLRSAGDVGGEAVPSTRDSDPSIKGSEACSRALKKDGGGSCSADGE